MQLNAFITPISYFWFHTHGFLCEDCFSTSCIVHLHCLLEFHLQSLHFWFHIIQLFKRFIIFILTNVLIGQNYLYHGHKVRQRAPFITSRRPRTNCAEDWPLITSGTTQNSTCSQYKRHLIALQSGHFPSCRRMEKEADHQCSVSGSRQRICYHH